MSPISPEESNGWIFVRGLLIDLGQLGLMILALWHTWHPCEPKQTPPTHLHPWFIIFVRLGVIPSAFTWVIASSGTQRLCFAMGLACYYWWLPPPRWLGVARIVEQRLVIVSGFDRGDCEGFLTIPQQRAKRYSIGLLVACVILILC
jgi:hypothetical protein